MEDIDVLADIPKSPYLNFLNSTDKPTTSAPTTTTPTKKIKKAKKHSKKSKKRKRRKRSSSGSSTSSSSSSSSSSTTEEEPERVVKTAPGPIRPKIKVNLAPFKNDKASQTKITGNINDLATMAKFIKQLQPPTADLMNLSCHHPVHPPRDRSWCTFCKRTGHTLDICRSKRRNF